MIQKKKVTNLSRILTDPNKKIDESEDDLTYLWRSLLRSRKIDESGFIKGLNLWLTRNINEGKIQQSKKSSVRGNVIRALSEPTMTYKTFQRGLSILRVEGIRIQIDAHFPLGVVEKHEIYSDSRSFDDYNATSDEK